MESFSTIIGRSDGFFPGSLWYLYQNSKLEKWKKNAIKFTIAVDSAKYLTNTHDLGFMINNSFGNGYLLTQNPAYKEVVVKAAQSLATRYRPVIGAIQSWDTTPNMGRIAFNPSTLLRKEKNSC